MILEEFKKYADQMGAQLSGILSVSFIGTEHGEILYNHLLVDWITRPQQNLRLK